MCGRSSDPGLLCVPASSRAHWSTLRDAYAAYHAEQTAQVAAWTEFCAATASSAGAGVGDDTPAFVRGTVIFVERLPAGSTSASIKVGRPLCDEHLGYRSC